MKFIAINNMKTPGKGPNKHHHPYEEKLIILDGEIEAIVDGDTQKLRSPKIALIPSNTSHEFKNPSDKPTFMFNIHPVPKMITERA